MKAVLAMVVLAASMSACGADSAAPVTPASTSLTKVIALAGNLAFGNLQVGRSLVSVLRISNNGTASMTVTALILPGGYTANWTAGTISAGKFQDGNVPTLLSPDGGAILPNSAIGNRPVWTFTWTAVPGATSYRLYVWRSGAALPTVDVPGITATRYDYQTIGDVLSSNLQGWQWVVQSDQGLSEPRTFSVASSAK